MKKLTVRFQIFLVFLFFLQYLLSNYLLNLNHFGNTDFEPKFKEYTLLNKYLKEKTDIIYFGDSVISALGKNDNDHRSIAEILQDMVPRYSVKSITHGAYHIGVYKEFCDYIIREGYQPGTIIIPINMRSFSPEWDQRPQYQFEIEKIILRGGLSKAILLAFYKPLRVFDYNFASISQREFWDTPVFNGNQQIGLVRDFTGRKYLKFSEKNMKDKILFFYMYHLSREHRKVKSLIETVRNMSVNNINFIIYITPINWEICETYLSGEFSERLKNNVRLLVSLLSKEGVKPLDLSMDLTSDHFTRELYPNEHLNQQGRIYVANQLKGRLGNLKDQKFNFKFDN